MLFYIPWPSQHPLLAARNLLVKLQSPLGSEKELILLPSDLHLLHTHFIHFSGLPDSFTFQGCQTHSLIQDSPKCDNFTTCESTPSLDRDWRRKHLSRWQRWSLFPTAENWTDGGRGAPRNVIATAAAAVVSPDFHSCGDIGYGIKDGSDGDLAITTSYL